MNMRFTLFLFISATLLFAQGVCEPEFVDDIDVRALDAFIQPLNNVDVYLTYQLSYGKTATTNPKTTGSDGFVHFRITNTEALSSRVNCDVTVYGTYLGQQATKVIKVGNHQRVDLKFDVYNLYISVFDQKGKVLTDAVVSIDGVNQTVQDQVAHFRLFQGDKIVFVSYAGGKVEHTLKVEEKDNYVNLQIGLYPMEIKVTDDNNNPLNADVIVAGVNYKTNQNGSVVVNNLIAPQQSIDVTYGDKTKKIDVDLSIETKYSVSFDFTSPDVQVKPEVSGEFINYIITAKDAGSNPSGIAAEDAQFSYEVDGSGSWKFVPLIPLSEGVFRAEVPKEGNIITSILEISDKEGNKNRVEARFVVPEETPVVDNGNNVQPVDNTSVSGSINQTTEDNTPEPTNLPQFPVEIAIVVFLVVIIAAYGVYRMKFAKM